MRKGSSPSPSKSKSTSGGLLAAILVVVIVVAVLAVGFFLFKGRQSSGQVKMQEIEEKYKAETGALPDASPRQFKQYKGAMKKAMKRGEATGSP